MRRVSCLSILFGLVFASGATRGADDAAERARIAQERLQVQQRYEADERECRERFAVTGCVEAARRERREALTRLRREENLIDEAERRRRAADRVEAIRRKVGEEEQRSAAAARRAARSADAAASAASGPKAPRPAREPAAEGPASSARPLLQRGQVTVRTPAASAPGNRSAEEARHRAAYEARQREARQRVEENRRRNAERDAGGKPPAPPLPASGAAPR